MTSSATLLLNAVDTQATQVLAPLVSAIDEGEYPRAYLQNLGSLGGFSSSVPAAQGGQGLGLATQINVTTRIAATCGSTAFMVWCQSTCAWYLLNAANAAVRERYLEQVARGELLAGTGMSNTVKHLAGIEKINLRATRTDGGYTITGSLPWVSNIGEDHLAIVAAHVEDEGYIMFAVRGNTPGLTLRRCLPFAGMEGTQTLTVRFDKVVISNDDVIAHPTQFKAYIQRIKPGFVLGQTGMGLGIIEASIASMRATNKTHSHVNVFLDDQADDLDVELQNLKQTISDLAAKAQTGDAPLLDVLKVRLATSELALRATQSEVLHTGAKGYLMNHGAQRRQREAVFVAIVTPALKHLRKEINDLEQLQAKAA